MAIVLIIAFVLSVFGVLLTLSYERRANDTRIFQNVKPNSQKKILFFTFFTASIPLRCVLALKPRFSGALRWPMRARHACEISLAIHPAKTCPPPCGSSCHHTLSPPLQQPLAACRFTIFPRQVLLSLWRLRVLPHGGLASRKPCSTEHVAGSQSPHSRHIGKRGLHVEPALCYHPTPYGIIKAPARGIFGARVSAKQHSSSSSRK